MQNSLTHSQRSGPIDRTPGTHGSDKNQAVSHFCHNVVILLCILINIEENKRVVEIDVDGQVGENGGHVVFAACVLE